jgi:hypothetical protein
MYSSHLIMQITSYEMLKNGSCKDCCTRPPPAYPKARGSSPIKSPAKQQQQQALQQPPQCSSPRCFASLPFGVVIIDESHRLRPALPHRPMDAQETTATVSAVRRAKRAVLLSGTPSLTKPYDLWNQVGGEWRESHSIAFRALFFFGLRGAFFLPLCLLVFFVFFCIILTDFLSFFLSFLLFCQVDILCPGLLGSRMVYAENYCDKKTVTVLGRGGKEVTR